MPANKLSPKEKRRLERFMINVTRLSRKEKLSETEVFIMKQQMRAALRILGAEDTNRVLVSYSIDVMRDSYPFKERRLRKLIYG